MIPPVQAPPRPAPELIDRLHDLAIMHAEILHQWEAEQDHEEDTDPELARKFAALRTELLLRQLKAHGTE